MEPSVALAGSADQINEMAQHYEACRAVAKPGAWLIAEGKA